LFAFIGEIKAFRCHEERKAGFYDVFKKDRKALLVVGAFCPAAHVAHNYFRMIEDIHKYFMIISFL